MAVAAAWAEAPTPAFARVAEGENKSRQPVAAKAEAPPPPSLPPLLEQREEEEEEEEEGSLALQAFFGPKNERNLMNKHKHCKLLGQSFLQLFSE